MDVLWKADRPMAAEEVTQALADDQEWAHPTVRSLLNRLVNKKAVAAKMEGRRYLYAPLVEKELYAETESRNLLDRLFEGRLVPFITQFANKETLTTQEKDELRRLIERLDDDR
jgi:predicted transcriptional regulator